MGNRTQPFNIGVLICERPSASAYSHGCRCQACRTAQRLRMRVFYAKVGGNKWRNPEAEAANFQRRRSEPGYRRRIQKETDQAHAERRRAQKLNLPTEIFNRAEIFNRDGWICGICGDPVSPIPQYPDPLSASLDHTAPLSLGGSHTRDNVRCSHLVCNLRRGNRGA